MIGLELEGGALTDLAVFLLDWGIKHLMAPGHVENWVIIVDMANVGSTSIPTEQLR